MSYFPGWWAFQLETLAGNLHIFFSCVFRVKWPHVFVIVYFQVKKWTRTECISCFPMLETRGLLQTEMWWKCHFILFCLHSCGVCKSWLFCHTATVDSLAYKSHRLFVISLPQRLGSIHLFVSTIFSIFKAKNSNLFSVKIGAVARMMVFALFSLLSKFCVSFPKHKLAGFPIGLNSIQLPSQEYLVILCTVHENTKLSGWKLLRTDTTVDFV